MSSQTDPNIIRSRSPTKKTIKLQTENYKDVYKNDWAMSRIYKNALKKEADKRGIKNNINVSSDDGGVTDDGASVFKSHTPGSTPKRVEEVQQQNAQDPDTTDNETSHYINTAIGFFKNFKQ